MHRNGYGLGIFFFIFMVSTLAAFVLSGCTYETPKTRELYAQAEVTAAEGYRAQAEGEAYAIKRRADAEAYAITQEANEQMAVTEQWIAERMAILRQEQSDNFFIKILLIVVVICGLSVPAQLAFAVWMYFNQKNQAAAEERRFYSAVIAMQRGKDVY